MTEAEKRYAQIEKENFGMVFACEKFHEYIYEVPNVKQTINHWFQFQFPKSESCEFYKLDSY